MSTGISTSIHSPRGLFNTHSGTFKQSAAQARHAPTGCPCARGAKQTRGQNCPAYPLCEKKFYFFFVLFKSSVKTSTVLRVCEFWSPPLPAQTELDVISSVLKGSTINHMLHTTPLSLSWGTGLKVQHRSSAFYGLSAVKQQREA